MKKIFLLVLTIFSLFCLVGCKTSKNTKEDFLKKISTVEGYKVTPSLDMYSLFISNPNSFNTFD